MTPSSGGSAPQILRPSNSAVRWLVARQSVDFIFVLFLACLVWWKAGEIGLPNLDGTGRRATYQTLAGLSATLLGLTMTTISVLASNLDKAIGGSPKGLPPTLVVGIIRPMFGLLRVLGFTLATSLLLLVLDTSAPSGAIWVQPLLSVLLTMAGLRLTRVSVLLSNLLKARASGA